MLTKNIAGFSFCFSQRQNLVFAHRQLKPSLHSSADRVSDGTLKVPTNYAEMTTTAEVKQVIYDKLMICSIAYSLHIP